MSTTRSETVQVVSALSVMLKYRESTEAQCRKTGMPFQVSEEKHWPVYGYGLATDLHWYAGATCIRLRKRKAEFITLTELLFESVLGAIRKDGPSGYFEMQLRLGKSSVVIGCGVYAVDHKTFKLTFRVYDQVKILASERTRAKRDAA